jgi:hypothetical protein
MSNKPEHGRLLTADRRCRLLGRLLNLYRFFMPLLHEGLL